MISSRPLHSTSENNCLMNISKKKKMLISGNKGYHKLLLYYHPDKRGDREPNKLDNQIFEYLQESKDTLLNSFEKYNQPKKPQLESRYNQKVLNKLKRSSNINEIENEDKPQQQDRHISKLKEIVNKNRERKIK